MREVSKEGGSKVGKENEFAERSKLVVLKGYVIVKRGKVEGIRKGWGWLGRKLGGVNVIKISGWNRRGGVVGMGAKSR